MEMPSSPNQHRGLACFHWWRAGFWSKGHVAGGESQNPIVPFAFLFINRKSRQTGHYGETWKHPIPFRPRYVESSCAICTEIVRETWSKPGEEMQISKILLVLRSWLLTGNAYLYLDKESFRLYGWSFEVQRSEGRKKVAISEVVGYHYWRS